MSHVSDISTPPCISAPPSTLPPLGFMYLGHFILDIGHVAQVGCIAGRKIWVSASGASISSWQGPIQPEKCPWAAKLTDHQSPGLLWARRKNLWSPSGHLNQVVTMVRLLCARKSENYTGVQLYLENMSYNMLCDLAQSVDSVLTSIHLYIYTHIHTFIYTYISSIHTYIHTYIYIYTYIDTYTYIHIYLYKAFDAIWFVTSSIHLGHMLYNLLYR